MVIGCPEIIFLSLDEKDRCNALCDTNKRRCFFHSNWVNFIAGSSKCTTKDLSCLLTKVLTTVKDGLIRYNNTKTSRNGVNSMWIVKNSTSLLSSLDQLDVRTATSVQTYDFSTLYTSIPHNLLKSRITALIHNSFKRRNGSNRYTHIKITSGKGCS